MAITLEHYLVVGRILLTIGLFGILLNRRNVIIILMSVELMLLSVNVNLIAFSTESGRSRRGRSLPVDPDRGGG